MFKVGDKVYVKPGKCGTSGPGVVTAVDPQKIYPYEVGRADLGTLWYKEQELELAPETPGTPCCIKPPKPKPQSDAVRYAVINTLSEEDALSLLEMPVKATKQHKSVRIGALKNGRAHVNNVHREYAWLVEVRNAADTQTIFMSGPNSARELGKLLIEAADQLDRLGEDGKK